MRSVLRRLGATTALVLAVAGGWVATADAARPKAGPLFGSPGANATQQAVLANIAGTKKGQTIEGVSWSFSDTTISNALIDAMKRGVKVRMLIGNEGSDYAAATAFRNATLSPFLPGIAKRSSLTISVGSSRKNPALGIGSMHQKSWTFSLVGRTPFVSIVTSANATENANTIHYTDGWQFVKDPQPYRVLRNMFNQQIKLHDWPRPFTVKSIGAGRTLTFSPWNSATMADPVVQRIDKLPNKVTIRAANASWTGARGMAIAQALIAKKAKGADVAVLYNTTDPASHNKVDQAIIDALTAAGIPNETVYFGEQRYLHGKFMTAKYGGQTRVWTGSENWGDEPKAADELVLMLTKPDAYAAFVGWWGALQAQS